MPIASFHYGPMDRQTNRQTDGASCLSTTKQVTQGHNIVADRWAGAFNRHPHPMPTPTNTRTQKKHLKCLFFRCPASSHSNPQSCKAGQRVSLTTYCPWATGWLMRYGPTDGPMDGFGVKNAGTWLVHLEVVVIDPSGYHICIFQPHISQFTEVFPLENRKSLKMAKMLILGPICSIRAGCTPD